MRALSHLPRRGFAAAVALGMLAGACGGVPELEAVPTPAPSPTPVPIQEEVPLAGFGPIKVPELGAFDSVAARAALESAAADPGRNLSDDEIPSVDGLDPTSVDEPSGGGEGDPEVSDPTATTTPSTDADEIPATELTEIDAEAVPIELPEPPPAVAGPPPGYADPSPAVLFASNRPIELARDANTRGRAARERGVDDTTIRVSGIVTETIAGLPERTAACAGAAARIAQAEVHAELTRTIELVGCADDEGLVERSASLATATALRDVFAVAPVASNAFLGDAALQDAGIPYVGVDPLPGFCGRDASYGHGVFGAQACPVLEARGYHSAVLPVLSALTAAVPEQGAMDRTVIAVVAGPRGTSVADQRLREAGLLGLENIEIVEGLPAASDVVPASWRRLVARLLESDPTMIVLESTRVEGLPRALRKAGFSGQVVVVGRVDPLDVALRGWRAGIAPAILVTPGVDLADHSTRGWLSMEGAAAAVGHEGPLGLDFVEGYLSMDFLIRAIAATPEPLSAEGLHDRIARGWWYPGVDGLSCGSFWPASHFIEVPCLSLSAVERGSIDLHPVHGLVSALPQFVFDLG